MNRLRLHLASDNACSFHRQILPARHCSPDFEPQGIEISAGSFTPDGEGWFSIHGLPRAEGLLEIARHKRKGGKFLWGLDDDFPSIPDWNPAKSSDPHVLSVWEITKHLADAILVSTHTLASTLKDVSHKVHVAPNLMDTTSFPPWDAEATKAEVTLPVKIGWAGGPTHKLDVAIVDDALCEILKRFPPSHVQVCWFGSVPPPKLTRDWIHKPGMPLAYQAMEPYPVYQSILNQLRPDIWLCPLLDIPFNCSKSNIRVLEAWGLQACPVASPVGEYNLIQSGKDGRYASSTEEWVSVLTRLVQDHEYRLALAREGRYRLGIDHAWDKFECRREWHEAYAAILNKYPPGQPGKLTIPTR